MGRWSQRQRAGGGVSLNFMVTAQKLVGDDILIVTYLSNVSSTDFDSSHFEVNGVDVALGVDQQSARQLRIEFGPGIGSSGSLEYTGNVPGVLTPQTILYSE